MTTLVPDWLLAGEPERDLIVVAAAALVAGLVLGMAFGVRLGRVREREVQRYARRLFEASEDRHRMATEAMLERARAAFGELSLEALGRSGERLLDLADARLGAERDRQAAMLEHKKETIDRELDRVSLELERVRQLVTGLERERARGLGSITAQLELAHKATSDLARTTQSLEHTLKNAPKRGQWGERLAEDLLRQAGFVEGASYLRQATRDDGGRPDFTFLLPRGRRLHMDVKFPLENYLRLTATRDETERTRFERAFLNDVRGKVKELAGRGYGAGEDTVDYVLMFIPSEPLAGFVFERRPEIVDEALAQKVVPCAPASLFAVLAVVRQAVDNFVLAEAADELLQQMARFSGEWDAFKGELARLGRKLEEAQALFEGLRGPRTRALERPLARLAELKREAPSERRRDGRSGEAADDG